MAMNKKEQAEFDAAKKELAAARALSWPTYGEQQRMDFAAARGFHDPLPGWYAHFYATINKRVSLGCFTSVSHASEGTKTTTQGPGRFYASKAEAWRQVRYEATLAFAKALADIDTEIAKAETEFLTQNNCMEKP